MNTLAKRIEMLEGKAFEGGGFSAIVIEVVEPSLAGPVILEPKGFTVDRDRYARHSGESVEALTERVILEASRRSSHMPRLVPIL